MSFFSFSFLLFSSRFAGWFSTRERERRARGQIFFSSFEHNKKRKNTCSVCAVKVAQTCDIKTDHQNRRRTRFVYPPRGRFLLCTWSRFDISTRARGIYFIMFSFLSSFFGFDEWLDSFFLFSSCKNHRGGLSFWSFQKKEKRKKKKKEIFFFFSFLLLSFLLSFLFARTRTPLIESSSVILQQRTIKL